MTVKTNKADLESLMAIEFAAIDMQMYLDTHPNDTDAIKVYNELVMNAMDMRDEYEEKYGALFSYVSLSPKNHMEWINEPWPWERT